MEFTALQTISRAFKKVRQTNSTDASHPSRIPTVTTPSGKGDAAAQTTSAVFDLTKDNRAITGIAQNLAILVPFGTGADTNTMLMRLIGWRIAYERDSGTPEDLLGLWIPVKIAEFTCTLSTPAGVANSVVGSTALFCDTIALLGTSGNDDVSIDIVSPGDDTIAHVVVDLKGFQKLEVTFGRNGSATACNALIAEY